MSNHELSILPVHERRPSLVLTSPSSSPTTDPPPHQGRKLHPECLPSQNTPGPPSVTPSSLESDLPSVTDDDPDPPPGYPKLAVQMGLMPEVAIFRRFGFLNAQNLLYMQAELVSLEERLRQLQVRDDMRRGQPSRYSKNWYMLSESADDGNDDQWSLVLEIREKLKEYNKALVQQRKIVSIDPPGAYDLRYIQRYLECPDMEAGLLSGKDAELWGDTRDPETRAPDLIALLPRRREDFFSRWVTESAVEKLLKIMAGRKPAKATMRRCGGGGGGGGGMAKGSIRGMMVGVHDSVMLRATFIIASVLASALPILSIAILFCVRSLKVRLGLIAVFNLLLSFSLAAFTSAKRSEVFAVSAAFSAVQVVFVQVGTNGTDNNGQ